MKLSIIITILLATSNIFGQDLNCQKFKNGEFKILGDSITDECILIRKGDLQIEYYKEEGVSGALEFIVHWVNDCTYTLTPTEKTLQHYGDLPKSAMLTIEILEVKENSYFQKSTINWGDFELTKEVFKVKKSS